MTKQETLVHGENHAHSSHTEKETCHCSRCGRKLKNPIKYGSGMYGRYCLNKIKSAEVIAEAKEEIKIQETLEEIPQSKIENSNTEIQKEKVSSKPKTKKLTLLGADEETLSVPKQLSFLDLINQDPAKVTVISKNKRKYARGEIITTHVKAI